MSLQVCADACATGTSLIPDSKMKITAKHVLLFTAVACLNFVAACSVTSRSFGDRETQVCAIDFGQVWMTSQDSKLAHLGCDIPVFQVDPERGHKAGSWPRKNEPWSKTGAVWWSFTARFLL